MVLCLLLELLTLAKTVCTLSKCRAARKHAKNWLLLVFLPLLAMETVPRPPWTRRLSNSSLKVGT